VVKKEKQHTKGGHAEVMLGEREKMTTSGGTTQKKEMICE